VELETRRGGARGAKGYGKIEDEEERDRNSLFDEGERLSSGCVAADEAVQAVNAGIVVAVA
jgi:hypothetical protein